MASKYIIFVYFAVIFGSAMFGCAMNMTINDTFNNQTTPSPTIYYSINPTQSPFNNTIIEDLLSSLPLSSFSWTDIHASQVNCIDPRTVGWCSGDINNPNSYLQVDLGDLFIIYSVSTWGIQDYGYGDEWIISYDIYYSTDGNIFKSYINNPLPGNTDWNNEQENVLNPEIIAQFLRFIPINFHNRKSFRVEASGSSYVSFHLLMVKLCY